jgi:fatty-acyl-CoA synthase
MGVAIIVRSPGSEVTAEDIIALCKDKLARFKVPKRVLFLDRAELPTTPTGKIQKYRLARYAASVLQEDG